MDHNVTIGAKVKAFRTAKKYTLKQLSEESGLSIGFLSQLERGLSSIAIDSLAKLATILGVSLSSFFDSSADQEKSPVSRSFAMHCSQTVSYTHLDVYKRQIQHFQFQKSVRKQQANSS